MANIIEKAFDASKNIVRTIFLGKPNLFTTSDLNRQIEALKYQMTSIENRLGAESDMEISFGKTGTNVWCKVDSGGYFRVNGLNIPLPSAADVFSENADYGTECYFYVYGSFVRKTYSDDPTHEIAGAKFTDGTSMPSADQLVLEEVHYDLSYDITNVTEDRGDFMFLIAKIKVLSPTQKYIHPNYKPTGNSVMMDSINSLEYTLDGAEENDVEIGDDFNMCINKLLYRAYDADSRINQLSRKFFSFNSPWKQNAQGNISFTYRIKGGMLHIIGFPDTTRLVASQMGSYMSATGIFQSSDATELLTYFNKLGYATNGKNLTLNKDTKYLFIPLGSCSVTGGDVYVYGHGEIGLMLSKGEESFTDIFIGAYVTDAVRFTSDGKVQDTLIGPVDIFQITGTNFTMNAFSAIIPLIE